MEREGETGRERAGIIKSGGKSGDERDGRGEKAEKSKTGFVATEMGRGYESV